MMAKLTDAYMRHVALACFAGLFCWYLITSKSYVIPGHIDCPLLSESFYKNIDNHLHLICTGDGWIPLTKASHMGSVSIKKE